MAEPVEVCTTISIPDSGIIVAALQSDVIKNDLQLSYNIKKIDLQKVTGCHTYLVTLENSENKQASFEVKLGNASSFYQVNPK